MLVAAIFRLDLPSLDEELCIKLSKNINVQILKLYNIFGFFLNLLNNSLWPNKFNSLHDHQASLKTTSTLTVLDQSTRVHVHIQEVRVRTCVHVHIQEVCVRTGLYICVPSPEYVFNTYMYSCYGFSYFSNNIFIF